MPETKDTFKKFTRLRKYAGAPYIVNADTECPLLPTSDANNVAMHVVNSASVSVVCTHDHTANIIWSHVGEDRVHKMIVQLSAPTNECIEQMKETKVMMTEDDQTDFEQIKMLPYL